jgi:hypothetical protein
MQQAHQTGAAVTDYPEECFRRGCASGGEGLALLPAGACSQHAAGPACAWLPGWSWHRTWQPWWACPRCARSCVMRLTCRAWHIVFDYDDADMAWETTRACVEERLQQSMEVMQQQGVVVSELVSSMQEDYRDESLRLLVDFKVKGVAVHCLVRVCWGWVAVVQLRCNCRAVQLCCRQVSLWQLSYDMTASI